MPGNDKKTVLFPLLFSTAKKKCFLCGNVGTPITEIAPLTTNKSLLVVEVSSFQMEATKNFQTFASAILNILPDHLDRHKTFENYLYNKSKILSYYKTKKIFNADDKNAHTLSKKYLNAKMVSMQNPKTFCLAEKNNLLGFYNLSNLCIASALAKEAGIKDEVIKKANQTFLPLNHRLKKVASFKNITFINDSKSTNIASTLSALESVDEKTILLLGGSSKNLDFSPLAKKKVFCVIGYGETLPEIKRAFKEKANFFEAQNIESAFNLATNLAINSNDPTTILLSPASASFDEFTGYDKRGEFFESLVENFLQNQS
ncbi:MAG: UDP-N-acetylmuramoyl-L-alanine--D-glutamate ligase [Clostridia bacterium]|nr:UDP-N-acetylmuramoyl-L-alanine--D-glutamate ligase [Clostridia bacterium]